MTRALLSGFAVGAAVTVAVCVGIAVMADTDRRLWDGGDLDA